MSALDNTRVLRRHPTNPHYLTVDGQKAVYLAGAHTWSSVQDMHRPGEPDFNYSKFLDFLEERQHNFTRLWVWEHAYGDVGGSKIDGPLAGSENAPMLYERTGPGTAFDGKPKYDLNRFNEAYFDRLRSRVEEAGERGIFVSVMLFQGFSVDQKSQPLSSPVDPAKENPWSSHPYNVNNNINGVDGDPNHDGRGEETHRLDVPQITKLQEAYVRKVIDTLNAFDHLIFEISNESVSESEAWHNHMIDVIKNYEAASKPKQHLVWFSSYGDCQRGDLWTKMPVLLKSHADIVSPSSWATSEMYLYRNDPPIHAEDKVFFLDTDHLWGVGGTPGWVWKAFLRGHHVAYMDMYGKLEGGVISRKHYDSEKRFGTPSDWERARRALTQTLVAAGKVHDLAAMTPSTTVSSTGYALCNPGTDYLVYQPDSGAFEVQLEAGHYSVEWLEPDAGSVADGGKIAVERGARSFRAPFPGHAVLHLSR
ncbi:MAG: hypothetical protein JXR37_29835 [Kiritimatiellae bacterium]|nr:hypothetical protein [Kiritimatiellia bacterium]